MDEYHFVLCSIISMYEYSVLRAPYSVQACREGQSSVCCAAGPWPTRAELGGISQRPSPGQPGV